MGAYKGQGPLGVGNRTPPAPAAPTVTAANEGLSLSGTTVQLGTATAATGGLAQITSNRHITAGAFGIQLNNISNAAASNRIVVAPQGITLTRENGGAASNITIQSNLVAGGTTVLSAIVWTINSAAGAASPSITLSKTGNTNQGVITNVNQTYSGSTLTGPVYVVQGTNAAGAVFASNFSNTSVAAPATVVSQWFVDNTVRSFQIIKYSDAGGGGTDLQHINATVGAAPLRLLSGSATSTIQQLVGGNIWQRTASRTVEIGDMSSAFNLTNLVLDDVGQTLRFGRGGQLKMDLNISGNSYAIGDISAITNGSKISVEDNISTVRMIANSETIIQDLTSNIYLKISPASGMYQMGDVNGHSGNNYLSINDGANSMTYFIVANRYLLIDVSNKSYKIGDIDNSGLGMTMFVDDINGNTSMNNTANTGTISTGDPGSGIDQWRLGTIHNVAPVLDTKYVEIFLQSIGSIVKLATVV